MFPTATLLTMLWPSDPDAGQSMEETSETGCLHETNDLMDLLDSMVALHEGGDVMALVCMPSFTLAFDLTRYPGWKPLFAYGAFRNDDVSGHGV